MTKQQIYDTIVQLTSEIKATRIATEIFDVAKSEKDGQKVKEVCDGFKEHYPDLYRKMECFANEFNEIDENSETGEELEIFGLARDEEKEVWVLDWNIINASSFFVFRFLTFFDDVCLFTEDYLNRDYNQYLDILENESKSCELAEYCGAADFSDEELENLQDTGYTYSNKYDLLVDVFDGRLKEYVG